ncbi:MAG: hypothetical protein PUJ11_04760 [Eubacteriaceae bacterium]|nr:hypothetical protein [Eubacteriaceae bacterium]
MLKRKIYDALVAWKNSSKGMTTVLAFHPAIRLFKKQAVICYALDDQLLHLLRLC